MSTARNHGGTPWKDRFETGIRIPGTFRGFRLSCQLSKWRAIVINLLQWKTGIIVSARLRDSILEQQFQRKLNFSLWWRGEY